MNNGLLGTPIGTDRGLLRKEQYAMMRQENPPSTEPGALGTNVWTTRLLNVIRDDEYGIIKKLESGIFTIDAGFYFIQAFCGAYAPEGFGSKLLDVGTNLDILYGSDTYGANTRGGTVFSFIDDYLEIKKTTRVAYQCVSSAGLGNTFAQGPALNSRNSSGEIEVTATLELTRVTP